MSLKQGDKKAAEFAFLELWQSVNQHMPFSPESLSFLGKSVPWFRAYHDPFKHKAKYRQMPQYMDQMGNKIKQQQQGISHNLIDSTEYLLQIVHFAENDPEMQIKLPPLLARVTGSGQSLSLFFYIMIKLITDATEKRLEVIPYYPNEKMCYRKAVALFRKYLRNKKKRSYLQQTVQNLSFALEYNLNNPKYHYALAVAYGYQSQQNQRLIPKVYFHLQQAIALGWQHTEFISSEYAFKHLREQKTFRNIDKTVFAKSKENDLFQLG